MDAAAIYDWNRPAQFRRLVRPGVTFLDETLRDGIQNPSVRDPSTAEKLALLHMMAGIGVHAPSPHPPSLS